MGGSRLVAGINVRTLNDLRKHLGLSMDARIWDKITQLGEITDDIIDKLKIDIKNVSPNPPVKKGLARDLAPGRGFIFAPIHIIQSSVPTQNLMAWWETLQEYGIYN